MEEEEEREKSLMRTGGEEQEINERKTSWENTEQHQWEDC
jgi:hypothetical protein